MSVSVKWRGLDRFQRDLERAHRRKLKKEIRLKLRDASKVVRTNMKKQVGGKLLKKQSGALHKAIKFRVRVRNRRSYYAAIGPRRGDAFYGDFHAEGTKNRAQKEGRFTGRLKKRDYVAAAIKETQAAVFKILGTTFKRVP